jgi:hypothetical protein
MFHLFETYLTELLSCCNISWRRKQAHADAVPTSVAVSTRAASDAGVWRINRHVARSPPACASIGMWRVAACVRARRAGTTIACGMRGTGMQAGQAPFHFFMSEAHSCGNRACGGKIVATPEAACSREGAAGAYETKGAGPRRRSTLGQARRTA